MAVNPLRGSSSRKLLAALRVTCHLPPRGERASFLRKHVLSIGMTVRGYPHVPGGERTNPWMGERALARVSAAV
jgi:hypothetical protein